MGKGKFFGKDREWWKDFGTPIAIAAIGILGSIAITCSQNSSAEKIANSQRQLELIKFFNQSIGIPKDINSESDAIFFLVNYLKTIEDEQFYAIADSALKDYIFSLSEYLEVGPWDENRWIVANTFKKTYSFRKSYINQALIDKIKTELVNTTDDDCNYGVVLVLAHLKNCQLTENQFQKLNSLTKLDMSSWQYNNMFQAKLKAAIENCR